MCETMREIGILVFVFAPLDTAFSGWSPRPEDIAVIIVGALGTIIAGIIIETGR